MANVTGQEFWFVASVIKTSFIVKLSLYSWCPKNTS